MIRLRKNHMDANMSNHWGSHMLNEALEALDELSVLSQIGPERTLQVVAKFLYISDGNDGNRYEVLENIGDRLRVCFDCARYSVQLEEGRRPECSDAFNAYFRRAESQQ